MVLHLSKEPSARLLKHVVRCYLRLSDNPRLVCSAVSYSILFCPKLDILSDIPRLVCSLNIFVRNYVSRVIRKPVFPYAQTGADQLRHNCTADHHLCFSFKDSTIPLFPKSEIFKPLVIFCGCTPRLVSDLV